MAKHRIVSIVSLLALGMVAAALLYQPLIRPWHLRWGATDAETQMSLPGDELAGANAAQSTRAIEIHAPAGQVWPWLLQLGQGRGGLYSYDFLENLAGCDIHTLAAVDPALQSLRVGDVIRIGRQAALPYYRVARIDPGTALVLRAVDAKTGADQNATWGFYLAPNSSTLTRLIVRHRDAPASDPTTRTINAVFEPISFVMERGMLHGIRAHAERLAQTHQP
jgi:hypothetical protein